MRNQYGSYLEKVYLGDSKTIETFVTCNALLSSDRLASISSFEDTTFEDTASFYQGANYWNSLKEKVSHFHNIAYLVVTPTWSSIDHSTEVKYKFSEIDVKESLNTIKRFAFLAVDEKTDSEIENYFASIPIKTKTILKNPRIKKG